VTEKSERIVRYTSDELDEMLRQGEDRTDWDRVRALTDEEVEASIDFEDEGKFDLSRAFRGMPPMPGPKQQLTVRFDGDLIDWFKGQGPGYQTRMNAVLRHYVEGEKRKAS